MPERPEKLLLLDTASLYFRAFYGVRDSVTAPDGTPVNAARGLLDMIAKLITLYEPTRIVACWDDDWRPQWRVDLIDTYKTHRVVEVVDNGPDIEEMPDPLNAQLPAIRESLGALRIPISGAADYEADDIIGTLATRADCAVDVVTGDRDLFQLVDDDANVRVIYTARGMSNLEIVTADVVRSKYGVGPEQYADFATMRGDASDGLPGVRGVGDKTAATLLAAHGTLDAIRAAAAEGFGMSASVAAKVLDAADYLDVAPEVVAVARDVDIDMPDTVIRPLDETELAHARSVQERWNLGGSMDRAIAAMR